MAGSMAKLFKEAFKEAGLELPKPEPRRPLPPKKADSARPATPSGPMPSSQKPRRPEGARSRPLSMGQSKQEKPLNTSAYSNGMPGATNGQAKTVQPQAQPDYHLSLQPESTVKLANGAALAISKRVTPRFDGRRCMMVEVPAADPDHDLKIGIDFGTSSTKIVIADKQQDKAFAVPFLEKPGVERYLLPGIIFKTNDYHLEEQGKPYRDLKLELLNETVSNEAMVHATAFLALAIRHARGWLFTEHAALYQKATIAWTLCIGMPSENPNDPRLKPRFERIGLAAWLAAAMAAPLTYDLLKKCLQEAEQFQGSDPQAPQIDLEIRAVPELAAQVYGHVASESFDPRGRNTFMMVDVGAGTVDSCLFHVHRDKKKKRWNFLMYTKAVEPHGTVNLHRHRLNWWERAIQRYSPDRLDLLKDLDNARYRTDCLSPIPGNLADYVSPAKLNFDSADIHPDTQFLKQKVKYQVFFQTYAEARNQQHLQAEDLTDMPTFLCGGGMRMPFYQQLKGELDKPAPNARWLRAKRMELSKPRKMLAPGLPAEDYDRLSVAYGLGMMDFGILEQSMGAALPTQYLEKLHTEDSFVSKDMV
ncbi:MAG: hypothetical protein AB1563_11600 [Bacillota bacterium]